MALRLPIFCLLTSLMMSVAACAPSPVAVAVQVTDTPRGPIVPTRVIPTATDTAAVTETPAATETARATNTPTTAPTSTPTATGTPTSPPAVTRTPTPTGTATATASAAPTHSPTATPSAAPTATPTMTDTAAPASSPTATHAPLNTTTLGDLPVAGHLVAGEAASATIDADHPVVLFAFSGTEGETVSIAMSRSSGDLDAYLLVLDGEGRELARNDDTAPDVRDAAVQGLRLPATGEYVVVATRYFQRFGSSNGDFELLLTVGEAAAGTTVFSEPTSYEALQTGAISNTQVERVYTFFGSEGDIVSIQMTTSSGNLDPALTLTDNLGNLVIRNDDDVANNTINAFIRRVQLPRTAFYSILASRYQGANGASAGDFRLKLTLDQPGAPGDHSLRYGVVDPLNSGSIRFDGQGYVDFIAGDRIEEDNQELEYQTLLTIYLPERHGHEVTSAMLTLGQCIEHGGGFAGLGELTVYSDPFGSLNERRSYTRPTTGAFIITTLAGCHPVDLTEVVRDAYANGNETIQLRLTFRNTPRNGTTDEVAFSDPRLEVRMR